MSYIDLTGVKFSRLTVINKAESLYNDGHACWTCKRECGKTIVVTGMSLRRGHTKSCGCFRAEMTSKRFTKH